MIIFRPFIWLWRALVWILRLPFVLVRFAIRHSGRLLKMAIGYVTGGNV